MELDAQRLAALREEVIVASLNEYRLRVPNAPAANDYGQRIVYENEVDSALRKLGSIEAQEDFLISRRQELGIRYGTVPWGAARSRAWQARRRRTRKVETTIKNQRT